MSRAQGRTKGKTAAAPAESNQALGSGSSRRRSGLGRVDDGMLFVFSHPLRIRMIAALNEQNGSASDLAKRLGIKTHHTNYHLKQLKLHDCVEVVRRVTVKGLPKTIYRAKVKVDFPEEVWKRLPASVKKLVVAAVFLTTSSDAQAALLAGSFEERPESHASWTSLKLDEQGWKMLSIRVDDLLADAQQLQADAKDRLAANKSLGLNVSLNLSAFVLPGDLDPPEQRLQDETAREKLRGRRTLRHPQERPR
ncbi:MAG: hypothetical protein ACJ76D_00615 [Solirubrobacterales bacterium]